MKHRIVSLIMSLSLALSLLPAGALAAGDRPAAQAEWERETAASAPRGAVPAGETPGTRGSGDLAWAVTGGNLYFDASTGTVTDCDDSVTAAEIPAKIDGHGVKAVGAYAFSRCAGLERVTVPSGVTRLGDGAFQGCFRLTEVTVPATVTEIGAAVFAWCPSLTGVSLQSGNPSYSVRSGVLFDRAQTVLICCPGGKSGSYTIPSGVRRIEENAFVGCTRLTGVTIPAGVTEIGRSAFYYCTGLTAVTIPDGVTAIAGSTFKLCSGLTKVTIPASVTAVGSGAFAECAALTDVYYGGSRAQWNAVAVGKENGPLAGAAVHAGGVILFPAEGGYLYFDADTGTVTGCDPAVTAAEIPGEIGGAAVTEIGKEAFQSRESLKRVTLPASVTRIGDLAFSGCAGLTEFTVPAGVTRIGSCAFSYCSGLTGFRLASGNTAFSVRDGVLFDRSRAKLVAFPGGKTGGYAAPSGVKTVWEGAFSGCGGLTEVTLPGGVTRLEGLAFYGCGGLRRVSLPESLSYVGMYAFHGCGGLTDVDFGGTEAQWAAVPVGDHNEPLKNAAIHCAASLSITAQPQDVTVGKAGDKAVFTVAAQGTDLTYAWYYRNLGASKWTKSSTTGPKFTLIISQDREVKCEVTGSGTTVTSAVAKGLVPDNTILNILPDVTQVANPSDKVSFQVTGGTGPYTWYYRNAGASKWSRSAVTGNKFSLVVSGDREAYCVSADGKQSAVATASIARQGSIQVTPQVGIAAKAGGRVTFTATGGTGPYAWYYRNAGALTWTKSAVTTNKFPILVGKDREVFCASGDTRSPVVRATVGK